MCGAGLSGGVMVWLTWERARTLTLVLAGLSWGSGALAAVDPQSAPDAPAYAPAPSTPTKPTIQLPPPPALTSLEMPNPPASFCSEIDRGKFLADVFNPTVDAA